MITDHRICISTVRVYVKYVSAFPFDHNGAQRASSVPAGALSVAASQVKRAVWVGDQSHHLSYQYVTMCYEPQHVTCVQLTWGLLHAAAACHTALLPRRVVWSMHACVARLTAALTLLCMHCVGAFTPGPWQSAAQLLWHGGAARASG